MSTKDTSGPAFPSTEANGLNSGCFGMTLRDYFAAKAMQALIPEGEGYNSRPSQIEPMCSTAYDWADAMLKAREV